MDWPGVPQTDIFFIDFDFIIFEAHYLNPSIANLSDPELFTAIFLYLDMLYHIVKPTQLLYIAINGTGPYNKCFTHRRNRFTRAQGPEEFLNGITPGSEMMEKLHLAFLDFIKKNTWDCQVIYDSFHTPGEAEHKFFDYIRSQRRLHKWNEKAVCTVYSTDADMVFLCLLSHVRNFMIMRFHDQFLFTDPQPNMPIFPNRGQRMFLDDFDIIHTGLLEDYLKCEFEDDDRSITDFFILSFLLGNTFIPNFGGLSVKKGHFNVILAEYKKLGKFIFSPTEGFSQEFPQLIENIALALGPQSAEKVQPQHDPDIVNQMVANFYWVFHYYTQGVPSWDWYYPYLRSPPLLEIARRFPTTKPQFVLGQPFSPFEELAYSNPIQSKRLLPACFWPIATEIFPNCFPEICTPKTCYPIPTAAAIRAEYTKLSNGLNEEEEQRNQLLDPFDFPIENPRQFVPQPEISLFSLEALQYKLIDNVLTLRFSLRESISYEKDAVIGVGYPFFTTMKVEKILNRNWQMPGIHETYNHLISGKIQVYTSRDHFAVDWSPEQFEFPSPLTTAETFPLPLAPPIPRNLTVNEVVIVNSSSIGQVVDNGGGVQLLDFHWPDQILKDGNWIEIDQLAMNLNLPVFAVELMLSSVRTNHHKKNFGLKLMTPDLQRGIAGYIRQKEVAPEIVKLLTQYIDASQPLADTLRPLQTKAVASDAIDLMLNSMNNPTAYVSRVINFVKDNAIPGPMKSVTNRFPTHTVIKEIETKLSEIQITNGRKMDFDAGSMIWRGKQCLGTRLLKQNDKVVYIGESQMIAFGTVGVVVDTIDSGKIVECFSIRELEGGTQMNGLLQGKTYFIAPYTELLCL